MAIDRTSVWVTQQLTTMPHVYPGWNLVTAAERAILEAQNVGSDGFDDERRRPYIVREAPKVPA